MNYSTHYDLTSDGNVDINQTGEENVALKTFKQDYNMSKGYDNVWKEAIQRWRQEYWGQPYGNEVEGKSKIVMKEIRKYSEWLNANVLDPFVSTSDIIKCYPTNPQSSRGARSAELVLNTQFCRQFNRFNFLSRALKILDRDGTCVIKTGWEYAEEERDMVYTVLVPQLDPNTGQPLLDQQGQPILEEVKEERREKVKIINRPTATLCRNEDIFLDPTCLGDMDNCQFIIHRFETDLSSLRLDGRYKNIDKIITPAKDPEYNRKGVGFDFIDEPRRKLVVYEYWGNYDMNNDGIAEPIVCAWVNDIIIRLEDNPYPDKKPPFVVTPFLPIPFELMGESNAELLSDTQMIKTAIMRGFIDNMANSNNAQIIMPKGTLDEVNRRRMLRGENFEINGDPSKLFVGSYNQLPTSIFNFYQMLGQEADSITGINTYGTNQTTNMLGESNTSGRGVLDGGNLRKLMVTRNISENMIKPLLRKWLEYNAELLDDETLIRISGDNFELIRRDDLYGAIDIDLNISTNEDNAIKMQELGFLLQTIGPNEDPNIRKMLLVKMLELFRFPELAEDLRNYVPQPDPLEVAKKEAEVQLLNSQAMESQASAQRAGMDGELKNAKIGVEQAKAGLIKQQGNDKALDYFRKANGLDQIAEQEEKQAQRDHELKLAKAKEEANILMSMIKAKEARDKGALSGKPSNRNPYNKSNN